MLLRLPVPPSPPLSGDGVAAATWVSRTVAQSAQGGARCEASAEVSGEIQLCSGQSLIDNGLWQPPLRTTSSLLERQSVLVNTREYQLGGNKYVQV